MLSILCKVKSPGGESEQLHLSVVAYYPVTTIGAWEYRAYLTFGIDNNETAISVVAVGCYVRKYQGGRPARIPITSPRRENGEGRCFY